MDDSNTLSESDNKAICPREDRKVIKVNRVLDFIRKNAPITSYRLSKELNISYSEMCRITNELEKAQLIKFRVVLNENNVSNKLIVIPDEARNGS